MTGTTIVSRKERKKWTGEKLAGRRNESARNVRRNSFTVTN